MSLLKVLALGISSSLLLSIVACGGADASLSDFNKGGSRDKGGFGDGTDDGSGTLGGGDGDKATPKENGDLAACATQSATAEARPVYLVFMFDKSGSMDENGSPKWGSARPLRKHSSNRRIRRASAHR